MRAALLELLGSPALRSRAFVYAPLRPARPVAHGPPPRARRRRPQAAAVLAWARRDPRRPGPRRVARPAVAAARSRFSRRRGTSPAPAASRSAFTDCLNFGNPEKPEIGWELGEAIEGIAQACEALGMPVVSGQRLALQRHRTAARSRRRPSSAVWASSPTCAASRAAGARATSILLARSRCRSARGLRGAGALGRRSAGRRRSTSPREARSSRARRRSRRGHSLVHDVVRRRPRGRARRGRAGQRASARARPRRTRRVTLFGEAGGRSSPRCPPAESRPTPTGSRCRGARGSAIVGGDASSASPLGRAARARYEGVR